MAYSFKAYCSDPDNDYCNPMPKNSHRSVIDQKLMNEVIPEHH